MGRRRKIMPIQNHPEMDRLRQRLYALENAILAIIDNVELGSDCNRKLIKTILGHC